MQSAQDHRKWTAACGTVGRPHLNARTLAIRVAIEAALEGHNRAVIARVIFRAEGRIHEHIGCVVACAISTSFYFATKMQCLSLQVNRKQTCSQQVVRKVLHRSSTES